MALRIYNKIIASLLSVLFFMSTQMLAQHPTFDQLKTRFQEGLVFNADFSHSYYDSYTGETIISDGKIWIAEQSYKLKSDDQELLVDGITSQVYDEKHNRLIISDYSEEDDDFAPSRMLQGVDSTYTVSEKPSGKGTTMIVLETDDEFALFVRVEIIMDENIKPASIVAYDFSDNVITTRFQNGKFLNNKGQLFLLKYPNDAEIVDTRY